MNTLKPFFTYFGGKYRAAPSYPKPLYETIVEPFAGSAGYSLRYPNHKIVLIEKYPELAALWRYLIRVSPAEILAIPDMAAGEHVDSLRVAPEARTLVGFWLNKGCATPRKTPSAWMRSGIRPGSFWGNAIRLRIARQVESIRHWDVFEGSYSDLEPRKLSEPHTWFIDPPYERAGEGYKHHDVNYTHLATWCRSLPGQRIVCEAEGASWLPFSPHANVKATHGGKRTGVCREVIWTASEAA